jgi:(p)ppGpp synthase/HD superfamily hydrolase
MAFTLKLNTAMSIASAAHDGQVRKGTNIPYISHPLAVCAIALEYGADEDQAAAALLHDTIEDGGGQYAKVIADALGDRVLALVQGCTDAVPDTDGLKPPWKIRKEAYLQHLRHAADDVLFVSAADKLHNARAIVNDLESIGTEVFQRFSSPMDETLWYYRSLSAIFTEREARMASGFKLLDGLKAEEGDSAGRV